ncbi:putative PAS/PAC sensor protein [Thalassoporum mexicanum PCC 7367]|uniref:response regulator n=1 Tax=Thalassoporum mexicanum TaxID=3457544 RepID=UPI00029F9289|nr:response regulator [Pseudanabaena sp. PCC 7367]AFY69996.1 putative PAS/PAC sensor protein [Pseudanabaena sp. PCC 7367]
MSTHGIFVVEDESVVALNIRTRLLELGYAVVGMVTTGESAIGTIEAMANSDRPDLVLMDVKLKGRIDGIETARTIRDRFDIPVVYLTAYTDVNVVERAKITEPYGYVIKPFAATDLRTAIEIALYRHQVDRSNRKREKLLNSTLASIGDALVTTDLDEKITFLNPIAQRLTGYTEREGVGSSFNQVVQVLEEENNSIDAPETLVGRAMTENRIINLPPGTLLVDRDLNVIPIVDSVAPIRDDLGEVVGAVMVFQTNVSDGQNQESKKFHRLLFYLLLNLLS